MPDKSNSRRFLNYCISGILVTNLLTNLKVNNYFGFFISLNFYTEAAGNVETEELKL